MPVGVQRQVCVVTVQETAVVPQLPFIDKVVDVRFEVIDVGQALKSGGHGGLAVSQGFFFSGLPPFFRAPSIPT